jgi:hypothetical protein
MFRNELHIISLALHLNYTSTAASEDEYEHDPWHKVQLVVDLFSRPWKYLYIPDQSVFLMKSLIGMMNKTAYIQHKQGKRYCYFWFKKFKLCKGNTGYIFHTELYSGKYFPAKNYPYGMA